jgi:hypothetical protein
MFHIHGLSLLHVTLLELSCDNSTWRLSTKQCIYLFQRKPLGFRNEEVYERNRQSEEGRKHEVCSIANVRHHVRYGASDDKIEKPVGSGAESHSDATNWKWENLCAVNPRDSCVRQAPSDCEDVDEGDGCITSSRKLRVSRRFGFGDLDVRADEPHSEEHYRSTAHKPLPATISIDEVVHGKNDEEQADDAVDSGGVEASRLSCEADGLEDAGREVVDGVGSGHLHEDEDEHTDEDASAVRGTGQLLPLAKHTSIWSALKFIFDSVHDVMELFLEIRVGCVNTAELTEDQTTSLASLVLGQPSVSG